MIRVNGVVAFCCILAAFRLFSAVEIQIDENKYNVTVLTVATEATDGFNRFMRSADFFNIPIHVLGFGEIWSGGDVKRYTGGGIKVRLLKAAIEDFKNDQDRIILFTDSYDVIFLGSLEEIVRRFLQKDCRILFSAEVYCWPDESLASSYPISDPDHYPYLNSGGIMGFAKDLYEIIISQNDVADNDDDQMFYTNIYLDAMLRKQHKITLDGTSDIFMNLNGISSHISILIDNNEIYLKNSHFDVRPLIAHGNGISKVRINSIGNYLPNGWSPVHQCIECLENIMFLDKSHEKPLVLLNIFIEEPTPFLEEFFLQIDEFKYEKKRIYLCIHNKVEYHKKLVDQYVKKVTGYYHGIKEIDSEIDERNARNTAFNHCWEINCDFVLVIDSDARLDEPFIIEMLIEQNRTILAPLLRDADSKSLMSNFWGALNPNGYYLRSSDYIAIFNDSRRGVWNVPFISKSYMVNMTRFKHLNFRNPYTLRVGSVTIDPDMSFCKNFRDLDIFMYVTNRYQFGHLVNSEDFNISRAAPELYMIEKNLIDWTKRYIHDEYRSVLEKYTEPLQPCTDVYWFPIAKKRLCEDLLAVVLNFGRWSSGSHYDERISGGYEAVPTRDIHMRQVGLHERWNFFLNTFVNPLAKLVYQGYHDDANAIMNFVVRYKPDEQPSLKPHHDSSTYTINLALNEKGVDYDGGGCRFVRYNCSVTETKVGWMLMHPGRLTHLHEGLPIIEGIRYIMISFVNP